MGAKFKDLMERINSKSVNVNGCLIWQGANNCTYGVISYKGKRYFAHRAVYEELRGLKDKNNDVCHTCDTPLCVNVDHLFEGSRSENMQDCVSKGRARNGQLKGSQVPTAKLNEQKVLEIRSSSKTRNQLAKIYNVSPGCIKAVRLRKYWKHI